jgi:hypothetical protein
MLGERRLVGEHPARFGLYGLGIVRIALNDVAHASIEGLDDMLRFWLGQPRRITIGYYGVRDLDTMRLERRSRKPQES